MSKNMMKFEDVEPILNCKIIRLSDAELNDLRNPFRKSIPAE